MGAVSNNILRRSVIQIIINVYLGPLTITNILPNLEHTLCHFG